MSKSRSNRFLCQPLGDLTAQLLRGTPDRRLMQMRRAEALHDQLQDEQVYPVDFLYFHITGFRRELGDDSILAGQAVRHDVRWLVDRLSRSLELTAGDTEPPMLTADALAQQWSVTRRSIERYRQQGLRWRWIGEPGKSRKTLAFTPDAIASFAKAHGRKLAQAHRYTHIPDEQRQRLIKRARRLAMSSDLTLNQIATRLAQRSGRSLEGIRQLLKGHDAQHPDEAIFADRSGPLSVRDKQVITRALAMGMSAIKLAGRFRRSRASIYRIAQEQRTQSALATNISYLTARTFTRDDADEVFLTDPAIHSANHGDKPSIDAKLTEVLPTRWRTMFHQPDPGDDGWRSISLRMHHARYAADRLRRSWGDKTASPAELDRFDWLLARGDQLEAMMRRLSLPLLLSLVRRHMAGSGDQSPGRILSLIKPGFDALCVAVTSYDATTSHEMTTFATNRIMAALTRYDVEHPPTLGRAARRYDDAAPLPRVLRRIARQSRIDPASL